MELERSCQECKRPAVYSETDGTEVDGVNPGAYCAHHLVQCFHEWIGRDFDDLNTAAIAIAASMAMGFGNKSTEEIVKISWDLAIELRAEGRMRTVVPDEKQPVNLEKLPAPWKRRLK